MGEEHPHPRIRLDEFHRRLLHTVGILLLAFAGVWVTWKTAPGLLVSFGGVLLAVGLDVPIRFITDHTPIGRKLAFGIVIVVMLAVLGALGFWIGPRVSEQVGNFAGTLSSSIDEVESWLRDRSWGRWLLVNAPEPKEVVEGSGRAALRQISGAVSALVGGLAWLGVAVVVGIFGAFNPKLYTGPLVQLFPPSRRERAREVLRALGHSLKAWLFGQIGSMTVVGLLTFIGLKILGLPLAGILGLITGLLTFIPYVGPFSSVVPAILVALPEGADMVVKVMALYALVQFIESNFATPIIQRKAVFVPPALLISFQLMMGLLAGGLGLLLAPPLLVAGVVLVQMLYVEDVLGEDVRLMGFHGENRGP